VRAALFRCHPPAALRVVPRPRLRLAADPEPERTAQLGDGKLGLPPANLIYTNTATWIVFSYIWLPFMILPVLRGSSSSGFPHS